MPSFHFLLYLLALAGIYLFRLSYIGWFGQYLLAAAAALPPLLLLLSLPSMLSLRVSLHARPYCTRGESCRLALSLDTGRLMPLNWVRVKIRTENLFTGETELKTYTYRFVKDSDGYVPLNTKLCGMLLCRVESWECRDLLGLFTVKRRGKGAARCAVLPASAAPDTPVNISAALNAAVTLKPKYGGGYSEEHELREYRPGDTVNSIHWKLSSKTDQVIVREPLVSANNQVFLLLSRVGAEDRGLECLYWLSLRLCSMEIPHIIVSDSQYEVSNERQAAAAIAGLLEKPMGPPCGFDRSCARCVFVISAGEVSMQ